MLLFDERVSLVKGAGSTLAQASEWANEREELTILNLNQSETFFPIPKYQMIPYCDCVFSFSR